ncbi:MAG: hypothetical protein ACRDIY_14240 [Chloroflexota bacterium]
MKEDANRALDIRRARTCYDHLAGTLGVALTERLVEANLLTLAGHGYGVTPVGIDCFAGFGIDLDSLRGRRRPLTRRCLDWTERRYHLAGALGAALARHLLERGWIERAPSTRAVLLTPDGRIGLKESFGLWLEPAHLIQKPDLKAG